MELVDNIARRFVLHVFTSVFFVFVLFFNFCASSVRCSHFYRQTCKHFSSAGDYRSTFPPF